MLGCHLVWGSLTTPLAHFFHFFQGLRRTSRVPRRTSEAFTPIKTRGDYLGLLEASEDLLGVRGLWTNFAILALVGTGARIASGAITVSHKWSVGESWKVF